MKFARFRLLEERGGPGHQRHVGLPSRCSQLANGHHASLGIRVLATGRAALAGVRASRTDATLHTIVVMWKTPATELAARLANAVVDPAEAVDASRDAIIDGRDTDSGR